MDEERSIAPPEHCPKCRGTVWRGPRWSDISGRLMWWCDTCGYVEHVEPADYVERPVINTNSIDFSRPFRAVLECETTTE